MKVLKGCLLIIGAVVVLLVVGIIIAATVTGSSKKKGQVQVIPPTVVSEVATTPTPGIASIIKGGNWEYIVTAVEKTKDLRWSEFSSKPAMGIWLMVYMKWKYTGGKSFHVSPEDFELRDSAGNKYREDVDTLFARYRGNLATVGYIDNYPPDTVLDAVVMYDVNPQASGFKLYLAKLNVEVDLGQ